MTTKFSMTAQLSRHVKKFVAIEWPVTELKQYKFAI